jgi:geranylgeranyl diphosphate synthase, type III
MLHNASLLIDDIQDNSKLRRGAPVAHSIYGVPLTINAANYVYFLAMQKALTLKHPDVTQIFVGKRRVVRSFNISLDIHCRTNARIASWTRHGDLVA